MIIFTSCTLEELVTRAHVSVTRVFSCTRVPMHTVITQMLYVVHTLSTATLVCVCMSNEASHRQVWSGETDTTDKAC